MTKQTYFVPYYGNKYREAKEAIEKGLKKIDWSKVTHICEPFAGSAGFSRFVHFNIPEYKGRYIWADMDKGLMEFLQIVKAGNFQKLFETIQEESKAITTKEEFKAYRDSLNSETGEGWYRLKRIRGGFRETLFDATNVERVAKLDKDQYTPLVNLLTSGRVDLYNQDSSQTLNLLEDLAKNPDNHIVVFCDPPYFQSCNSYYSSSVKVQAEQAEQGGNIYHDPDQSKMFVDILKMMKNPRLSSVLVINHSALMAQFYEGFVVYVYDKAYAQRHKNKQTGDIYIKGAKHMIVSNWKPE
jgi:site-specific DNA-adenine methylase